MSPMTRRHPHTRRRSRSRPAAYKPASSPASLRARHNSSAIQQQQKVAEPTFYRRQPSSLSGKHRTERRSDTRLPPTILLSRHQADPGHSSQERSPTSNPTLTSSFSLFHSHHSLKPSNCSADIGTGTTSPGSTP